MLDQVDAPDQLALLARCRDDLRLSPQAELLLEQRGFAPSQEKERRRYPRMRTNYQAPLQVIATLPAVHRSAEWHAVRLTDLSRQGVGLLHSRQLYPTERVRLVIQNGAMQQAEVIWCQRLSECCYRVGCSFVAAPAGA